ncbi:6092_t:CDS:2, partial [Dentiscutata erythropus]
MPPKKVQPLRLNCLIHGDPGFSAFSVEINKSQNVSDLSRAITENQRQNLQRAALGDRNADITNVFGGQILNPLDSIGKKFPTLSSEHIHIIVEIPPNSAEFQSESSIKQIIDMTIQQFTQYIDKGILKKPKVSLSKMGQFELDEMLNRFGLVKNTIKINMAPTQKSVAPFYWDPSQTEDQHAQDQMGDYGVARQGYLSYLKSIITLTSEIDWYDPRSKKDLLSLNDEALPFIVSGTTDVVIADKLSAKAHDLRNGIHVGFVIKKKIQDTHVYQATGKLLIANIISQFPLSNDKKVMQCPTTLLNAINIIETALEEDGLKQFLERPKVVFKFDNDIANMNDVLE